MRKLAALFVLAVSIAFAPAQAPASTPAPTPAAAKQASNPATQTQLFKATPTPAATTDFADKSHTFEVNDVKGLLLTCIAPQLDTNPDTDLFNNCTLAPGRTLDDVMHTFIQAIHVEQNERLKERAEWKKDHEEKPDLNPAQR